MVVKLALAGALALAYRGRDIRKRNEVPPFIGASPEALFRDLKPAPIEPTWILAGEPQARVAQHSCTEDKCSVTAMWDCTAGSFRWYFGDDETVVILEGEVFITAADGTQRLLRAGDIGYFKAGTWATWRIDTYVRKIAFMRQPIWLPLALFYRIRNRLRRRIKGSGLGL
ncbi:cupin domain-containing protein [Allorhizobium pseudoryzae]|jgi:hypothetical protein|uniref:cupin domain-containing protein n=1 Tax=Allorhizobium pseudoryzae TaxID=379684 RepID=UPI0013EDABE2|nr:cupin domain-containing protein [Allorhizobium pseudoryzae]